MQVRSPVSGIVTDYSIYESFTPEGEDIVLLAKFVAALANSIATLDQPVSSFDLSVVGPLYFVTHECRDPCLRRRAIALLRSAPRQEDIWDT